MWVGQKTNRKGTLWRTEKKYERILSRKDELEQAIQSTITHLNNLSMWSTAAHCYVKKNVTLSLKPRLSAHSALHALVHHTLHLLFTAMISSLCCLHLSFIREVRCMVPCIALSF